jgi:phosphatidylglycerophosphatase C
VRRLESWLAGESVELWAYGDSSGDDELLAFADHPTRITR